MEYFAKISIIQPKLTLECKYGSFEVHVRTDEETVGADTSGMSVNRIPVYGSIYFAYTHYADRVELRREESHIRRGDYISKNLNNSNLPYASHSALESEIKAALTAGLKPEHIERCKLIELYRVLRAAELKHKEMCDEIMRLESQRNTLWLANMGAFKRLIEEEANRI